MVPIRVEPSVTSVSGFRFPVPVDVVVNVWFTRRRFRCRLDPRERNPIEPRRLNRAHPN